MHIFNYPDNQYKQANRNFKFLECISSKKVLQFAKE